MARAGVLRSVLQCSLLLHLGSSLRLGAEAPAQNQTSSAPPPKAPLAKGLARGQHGFAKLEDDDSCWDSLWMDTPYRLTRRMCRKSRAFLGDLKAMQGLLTKLHTGKCISVVTIGGSVTVGRCLVCRGSMLPGGSATAWPAQFSKWLNKNFPCREPGGHKVHNLAVSSVGSDFWVNKVSAWRQDHHHAIWQADMIVVETATNDVNELQKAQAVKGMDSALKIQTFTELLARELKAAPREPLIVWAAFAWRNFGPGSAPPSHNDAALSHLPVLQYYNIEQVSLLNAFLPFTTNVKNKWVKGTYFSDCCHPTALGHQMCAQVLGNLLLEESNNMNAEPHLQRDWFEPEDRDPDTALQPLFVSSSLAKKYDSGATRYYKLWDEAEMHPLVLSSKGFTFGEDVPGKPGLLGYELGATLLLGIPLQASQGQADVLVNLGLLKSYEHMGMVTVSSTVDSRKCAESHADLRAQAESAAIDCLWNVHASVHQTESFSVDLHGIVSGCMVLRFEVKEASPPRAENKIKLLGLTVTV